MAFHRHFTKEYGKYVLKSKKKNSILLLSDKLEQATIKLRQDIVETLSSTSQKEQVMDITFTDKVLGEVK